MAEVIQCTMPWTDLYIPEEGEVKVCCWAQKSIGNLSDCSTLDELWNGKSAREFRRKMLEGDLSEICSPVCPHLIQGTRSSDKFYAPDHDPKNPHYQIRSVLDNKLDLAPVPPLDIGVVIDDKCALRCIMCLRNTGIYSVHPNFYRIFEKTAPTLETLALQGGEPFFSTQVLNLMKQAAQNPTHYKFAFITSLSHLPLQLLQKIKIAWMIVSIDGATKATYEIIRRRASWENLMKNLSKLLNYHQTCDDPFNLRVEFTVMKQNFHEIPDAVNLFNELEVPVAFHWIHRVGIKNEHLMDPFQFPSLYEDIEKAIQKGIEISYYDVTKDTLSTLLHIFKARTRLAGLLELRE
jgi:MoaA/NifB/PqqE/SkfB family radical SAM enzyme